MKRRNFLKKVGALIGLSFVNPIALIPEVPKYITVSFMPATVVGNTFIRPDVIAAEALSLLEEDLIFNIIEPAAKQLADNIDRDIANLLLKGEI